MSDEFALTLGAQSDAAGSVVDSCEVLGRDLDAFGSSLESHMPGVTGAAMATLAECVDVWAESFKVFYADLEAYAQALVAVDETTATTDQQVGGTFVSPELVARMEG